MLLTSPYVTLALILSTYLLYTLFNTTLDHSFYSKNNALNEQLTLTGRGVSDSLVAGAGGARGTSRQFCGNRIEEKQFCCYGRNRIEGKPTAAGRRAFLVLASATVNDFPDFNYSKLHKFLILIALF